MSKRERTMLFVTLAVVGIFVLDRYALTPFLDMQDRQQVERDRVLKEIKSARSLGLERKDLAPKWRERIEAGLKDDPAEAEGQVLHALRDWAKECGLTLTLLKPERPESKSELREVQIQALGTGNMQNVSKFLWSVQNARFPLKIKEFQLNSRTDGKNDLALQLKVSTLYLAPLPPAGSAATKVASTNGAAQ